MWRLVEWHAEQKKTKVLLGISNGTVDVRYIGKFAGLLHPRWEARRSSGELFQFQVPYDHTMKALVVDYIAHVGRGSSPLQIALLDHLHIVIIDQGMFKRWEIKIQFYQWWGYT